jgi:hypothetical protein
MVNPKTTNSDISVSDDIEVDENKARDTSYLPTIKARKEN